MRLACRCPVHVGPAQGLLSAEGKDAGRRREGGSGRPKGGYEATQSPRPPASLPPAQSRKSGAHQCPRGATWQSPARAGGAWSLRPEGKPPLPHLPMDSSPQPLLPPHLLTLPSPPLTFPISTRRPGREVYSTLHVTGPPYISIQWVNGWVTRWMDESGAQRSHGCIRVQV